MIIELGIRDSSKLKGGWPRINHPNLSFLVEQAAEVPGLNMRLVLSAPKPHPQQQGEDIGVGEPWAVGPKGGDEDRSPLVVPELV